MTIVLGRPSLRGSTLAVEVEAGGAGRYLRSGTVWADYGDLDLSGVDPAVLVLPALGAVLPVAYASGVPVRVDAVDADFAASAQELAALWPTVHPAFADAGAFSLHGTRVPGRRHDPVSPSPVDAALLLYSGGVDSSASLLRHRDGVKVLLSVWGADVALGDVPRWQAVSRAVDASPVTAGLRRVVVRTNVRDMTKDLRLSKERLAGTPWWAGAQHGTALLSLAAPVTTALGLGRVYVAASYHVGFSVPWGSSPATDEAMRWTGTHVVHDGFGLSRQDKITRLVAPQVRTRGHTLAVCYRGDTVGRVNCGSCEKCLRTAAGLLLAGTAPSAAGLDVQPDDFDAFRSRVAGGGYGQGPGTLSSWRDMQPVVSAGLGDVPPHLRDFFRWLATVDLDSIPPKPFWSTSRRWTELRRWRSRVVERLPAAAPRLPGTASPAEYRPHQVAG
jgi:hypothetical protein